jgi:hypothetical protein
MMYIMNIIMMRIINRDGARTVPEILPIASLKARIRNEAPRDDEAGLTGSLAPDDAGISEGKLGD